LRSIYRTPLALAALLAGLLLALLSALTARILLLLAGFLLIGLLLALLAAMLTALAALAALAALLAALIWIIGHWKRLLIAGWPRKFPTNHNEVGSGYAAGTCPRFDTNASQGPMRFPEHK
jgi:hypothetical protein